MPTKKTIEAKHLAITARGEAWLQQFDISDREMARELLNSLTLVSHIEFERTLAAQIVKESKRFKGPVALFATREIDPGIPYFIDEITPINAVPQGSDLGSEARVAAIIRNLARADAGKFLNHPTIEILRERHCRAIFVIDDFIGSGERTAEFIQSMWMSRTLRSWKSLHLVSIEAIAYSGIEKGIRRIERLKSAPRVHLERDCPTFCDMPWRPKIRREMLKLIKSYGRKTSRPSFTMGYGTTAAALVFEHGCPDNCPAVLWAPKTTNTAWSPLFPERSILPAEASAFPPEITKRDPAFTLVQAGQDRLAKAGASLSAAPLGPNMLIIIALVSKGIRTRAALSHATSLSAVECSELLDRCVRWGFLTVSLRLTPSGSAELKYARTLGTLPKKVPSRGADGYYPKQLRRPVNG